MLPLTLIPTLPPKFSLQNRSPSKNTPNSLQGSLSNPKIKIQIFIFAYLFRTWTPSLSISTNPLLVLSTPSTSSKFPQFPFLKGPGFRLSTTASMASFKSSISMNNSCDPHVRTSGEVHVIVGPMFAGKTTALLRRIKSKGSTGRNIAIIKSSKDTRYAIDSVVTHDGMKFPCLALPDLLSFRQKFGDDAYEKLDVIGIDEAQFFEDLYDFCCKAADHDGKTVIVAGLDGDYLRRSFGSVLDIIPLADSVTKLTARCEICGKQAFFTLRKTKETQTELIGGADVYMPVCRQHYANGQVVMEAARNVLESYKVKSDSFIEATSVV